MAKKTPTTKKNESKTTQKKAPDVAVLQKPVKKPRKPKKRPVGRPTELTEKMMEKVCIEIACGKSLRTILAGRNYPSESTFFQHLSTSDNFRSRYSTACELRACHNLEDIVAMTENIGKEYVPIEDKWGGVTGYAIKPECDPTVVTAKIKSKQWLMAKQNPRKYGAKVDVSGETKVTGKLGLLTAKTDEEVDELLKELAGDE